MNDPFRKILWHYSFRFRRAIESSDPAASPLTTLRTFPRGACGDASLLLAKYLQVNKCGLALFVLGNRGGAVHAWLELEKYVIDITADQFEDQGAGVIVRSDSSWHSSFNGKVHSLADFCLYDPRTVFELTRAYQAITRSIVF